MDVEFEWDAGGPGALEAKFEAFDAALDQRLEEAIEQIVLLIEGTAKTYAPVDTGRLRSSISSEVRRESANIIAGYVGTNLNYAEFQEWGTSEMGANPFLRPAVKAHRDDAERLVIEAVEDAADDAGLT